MSAQHAANLLKWVRFVSDSVIKDFPESAMTRMESPTSNHALWVLGHLASTDAWIASVANIPGISVPETYAKLFGSGSKPVASAASYPKPAEVRKLFDANRAALLKWLESASPAALATPLKEKTGGFCDDPIDGLYKLAWHEGWHFGQVATIRKAMGLPSVM